MQTEIKTALVTQVLGDDSTQVKRGYSCPSLTSHGRFQQVTLLGSGGTDPSFCDDPDTGAPKDPAPPGCETT